MAYTGGMSTIDARKDAGRLLPVLTHVQTHLNDDLSLEVLAGLASLSASHFHRLFHHIIGETPKQYTQRLRLEQAAYQLKLLNTSILDIAINTGYHSHETFSRAFRRQFGITPKMYRRKESLREWIDQHTAESLNHLQTEFQISRPAIVNIQPISVAFIRNLGPYVDADMHAYDRLISWVKTRGFYRGDNLLLGVGHDDPTITPAEKLRFDACIEIDQPAESDGEIGFQVIPEGIFARTTYIGPYGRMLEQAYGAIFQQLFSLKRYQIIGIPAIEIYRTTRINPSYELNHTDIYLPVEKLA